MDLVKGHDHGGGCFRTGNRIRFRPIRTPTSLRTPFENVRLTLFPALSWHCKKIENCTRQDKAGGEVADSPSQLDDPQAMTGEHMLNLGNDLGQVELKSIKITAAMEELLLGILASRENYYQEYWSLWWWTGTNPF